jgi:outer membrane protein insertion porin family
MLKIAAKNTWIISENSLYNSAKIFLKTLILFLLFSQKSFAVKVEITGNQRVEKEMVESLIDLQGLQKNSEEAIKESLKNLYESELFLESNIYKKEEKIIVELKENPIVSEVKIIGNKKIEDEDLKNEIFLKKRSIFTKSKLQSDLKRISEIYLKSGRFLTKIEPKIIQKEQNRVEIIFDIFEGPKAKISDIYLIGNEAFSDSDLKNVISTKETKWWKFLSSSDSYDSDRIEFDKEKLRIFYTSNGYADFAAISSIAQISPKKDRFFISFLIEEGIKYNIGKIDIINKIKNFDADILQDKITFKSTDIYNSSEIDKAIENMVEIMSEKAFAFANIEPVLKRNKEEKTIDIDFVISESPRIYINKIEITGNVRTINSVILRELRFKEGDAYNITRINRSKQRLENLGFFEKVEFDTKRIAKVGDLPDQVDLTIKITEKKTGELTAGIGYSTVDRLSLNAGIRERNLGGTGRDLGINVQKSFARLSSNINYTKPFFMGYPVSVGFDVFKNQLSRRNSLVYDQDSQGFSVRSGYAITEYLNHFVNYSFSDQSISNINPNASIAIKNLEGDFLSSAIAQTFSYDKRNNNINPTDGYFLSLTQTYTGIGGNIKTIKHEGTAGLYVPIYKEDFVAKFLLRGGIIDGMGQDVRNNFGFFLGGNDFRGFEFAGLGPRAVRDGDSMGVIGGNQFYVATAELRFPLGLPKDLGIHGILFSDNGTVKGVDEISKRNGDVIDTGSLRSSYGLSIAWSSPMGPIRLDFSKIAKKEDFDRTQNFQFSFGTTF